MIRVEHLKKEYISKNKIKSRGIVDISFVLPSTGFVFVLYLGHLIKKLMGKFTLIIRILMLLKKMKLIIIDHHIVVLFFKITN